MLLAGVGAGGIPCCSLKERKKKMRIPVIQLFGKNGEEDNEVNYLVKSCRVDRR